MSMIRRNAPYLPDLNNSISSKQHIRKKRNENWDIKNTVNHQTKVVSTISKQASSEINNPIIFRECTNVPPLLQENFYPYSDTFQGVKFSN